MGVAETLEIWDRCKLRLPKLLFFIFCCIFFFLKFLTRYVSILFLIIIITSTTLKWQHTVFQELLT